MSSRPLSRAEKHVLSQHLLHSWRMFFWAGAKANAIPKGSRAELRALHGVTLAAHMRRLISFYTLHDNRPTDVNAGDFVPAWKARVAALPPVLQKAVIYANKYVLHLTESHLNAPVRLPVPEFHQAVVALAPLHSAWLRDIHAAGLEDDLHPDWKANMQCFRVVAEPQRPRGDGLSEFQTVHFTFKFETVAGELVSDPPAFLRVE